jgi:ribosomal protein L7/L12
VIDGHNELEEMIDVTLVSCGNSKIETIKTVKEFTGLSLQEAKDMVDGVYSEGRRQQGRSGSHQEEARRARM